MPPAPPGPSSAAPEPASPNWFAPKTRSADAAPPATEAPADAAPADEDDDWPTRYSWLDEEPGESPREVGAPAGQDPTQEVEASASAASDLTVGDTPAATPSWPKRQPRWVRTTSRNPDQRRKRSPNRNPDPPSRRPGTPTASRRPPPAGPDTAAAMVAVLPGVPRYHQPDCVLIRFMPDDDIQRLPAAAAKADGYTPCAACQPGD